ncbi:MAG TPA: hypothetical protein VNT03_10945 [Baekduia sp.]|nr:hypothetical protein [Baekduia sp.]
MADRVDPWVEVDQPAGLPSMPDLVLRESEGAQITVAHNAVLSRREPCDAMIRVE